MSDSEHRRNLLALAVVYRVRVDDREWREWAEDRLRRPSRAAPGGLARLREWLATVGLAPPLLDVPDVPDVPHPLKRAALREGDR